MKRWGKSPPRSRQRGRHGKPRLEQGQICGERRPLDQDAAGRLLEGMGDHARREMIVRATKVARQNPAYRPIADNVTTSDDSHRRLFVCINNCCLAGTFGYSTRKNAMADPFLPPVWVQYRHSNIATHFSNACRTGRARNNASFGQCLDFQLFSRYQTLQDLTKRGY